MSPLRDLLRPEYLDRPRGKGSGAGDQSRGDGEGDRHATGNEKLAPLRRPIEFHQLRQRRPREKACGAEADDGGNKPCQRVLNREHGEHIPAGHTNRLQQRHLAGAPRLRRRDGTAQHDDAGDDRERAQRVQTAVVAALPNVTVINVGDVMDKVLAVLANLGMAVKALGAFTVIAGVVVLGGTVAATQARRAREVALLKTIGMTRRDVAAVFAVEYALTGAVAAVVGLGAGGLLAWAVLTRLMELPWSPRAAEVAGAALVTVALAVAAGLTASARALATRPVEVLRSE